MEKEQVSSLKKIELIHSGEASNIYRLEDNRLLKLATPIVFQSMQMFGLNYEEKIHNTSAITVKEIVSPITAVYDGRKCIGYTMEEIKGPNLIQYDDALSAEQKGNLHDFFRLYEKLETAVIKANKLGVVFPDLCTCDNIIFANDGSVRLIDFDGLQIGKKDRAYVLSTSLGRPEKYLMARKYCTEPFHFTKELDITSLTMLMFLWVFNIDLKTIGTFNPFEGKKVDLKYIFDTLGIQDLEFMNKVAANMDIRAKGSYLTSDLKRIVDNYNMYARYVPEVDMYAKRLVRK